MSAAFVFIILLPLLDGTIEKFGGIFCIAVIFLLPRILGIGFQGGSKPYSFLLIFVAGMLCCKYNFFQNCMNTVGKIKIHLFVCFTVCRPFPVP